MTFALLDTIPPSGYVAFWLSWALIGVLAVVILIEWTVASRFLLLSRRRVLLGVVLANLVSTAIGAPSVYEGFVDATRHNAVISFRGLSLMLVGLLLSILIESLVCRAVWRSVPKRETFGAVVWMNAASYGFLIGLWLIIRLL